jgi:hypothetical protein
MQRQNCDDSLASSKRIYPNYERNWRLKWKQEWRMQYDETTSKYVRYVVNILQEMKIIETRRVSRVDVKTYPFTIT